MYYVVTMAASNRNGLLRERIRSKDSTPNCVDVPPRSHWTLLNERPRCRLLC